MKRLNNLCLVFRSDLRNFRCLAVPLEVLAEIGSLSDQADAVSDVHVGCCQLHVPELLGVL